MSIPTLESTIQGGVLIGTFTWNLAKKTVTASAELAQILGTDPKNEPSLANYFAHIHPDDRARVEEIIMNAPTLGRAPAYECRIIRDDGVTRRIITQSTTVVNDDGVVTHIVGCTFDVTSLMETRDKLLSSERRFRTLFENANDAVFIMRDELFVDCNEKTLELFGATRADIIGRSPYHLSPPRQPDGVTSEESTKNRVAAALAGAPQIFEWRHKRPDGSMFDAEVSLNAIELEDGTHLQAIVRDVSEKKRASERIAHAQALLQAAFQQSPTGILVADAPTTEIRIANRAALEILQADPTRATVNSSQNAYETRFFNLDRSPFPMQESPIARALAGEATENVHIVYRRNDGDERRLLVNGAPILGEDGKVVAGVVAFADVTELHQVEQALRDNEEKYRNLFDWSPEALAMLTSDQTVLDINSVGEHLLDTQRDTMVGKKLPIENVLDPDDRARWHELWGTLQVGERAQPIEVVMRQRGREPRHLEVSGTRTPSRNGFEPILITARDITDRKKNQERSRAHEQQLIQAQKMASLGILVSGIAHEINNPNNVVLLNARVLARSMQELWAIADSYAEHQGDFAIGSMPYSEARGVLRQAPMAMADAALRIQKIIDSLKSFARHDDGNVSQVVDINRVVESALIITNHIIKRSTHRFSARYAEGLPRVLGNFQQLELVVINLITNACEAILNKDKRLQLFTEWDEARNVVQVIVEDEGKGIAPEDKAHILDPFFTTRRDSGGTGLGLFLSYNLVRGHGGDIVVTSEQGRGTRVTVELPARSPKPGSFT